ncbi:epididymal secretory glutathione peroxidase-like [Littorina saxatilis]|uniref:epididymal secretory glutathione peroxidase-like n=1 Tax=Littorina saxatilis TaxID=31220 RepID=UPI0038B427C3
MTSTSLVCTPGFTHQYKQLNALLSELRGGGYPVSILGVPCNQFGHQEPAANRTELHNSLRYVRPGAGYFPAFNLTGRSDVNGGDELPLYSYLKSKCAAPGHASYPKTETFWDPIKPTDITWNFEKFLIGPNGHPLLRFMPDVEPFDLRPILTEARGSDLSHHLAELELTVGERVKAKEKLKRFRHH